MQYSFRISLSEMSVLGEVNVVGRNDEMIAEA